MSFLETTLRPTRMISVDNLEHVCMNIAIAVDCTIGQYNEEQVPVHKWAALARPVCISALPKSYRRRQWLGSCSPLESPDILGYMLSRDVSVRFSRNDLTLIDGCKSAEECKQLHGPGLLAK